MTRLASARPSGACSKSARHAGSTDCGALRYCSNSSWMKPEFRSSNCCWANEVLCLEDSDTRLRLYGSSSAAPGLRVDRVPGKPVLEQDRLEGIGAEHAHRLARCEGGAAEMRRQDD